MAQVSEKTDGVTIDRDVPIPARTVRGWGTGLKAGTVALRALARGEAGASVFIPRSAYNKLNGIFDAVRRTGGKGWATVRTVDGGWRVWKIAEPEARS